MPMKVSALIVILIILFSGCKVVKNNDVSICANHNCKVRKGFAQNHYGRACVGQDGNLIKIGRCGGCVVPINPFKRYSYIKYCPKCTHQWKKENRDKAKNK
jgi:hypothetical protein